MLNNVRAKKKITTTRFDGLTTDICRTNGEAENRFRVGKTKKQKENGKFLL